MALILIIIHYYKNVFAHKRYYYAYDSNATTHVPSSREYTNAHA